MDTQLNNSRTRVGIQSLFQSLYSFPQHQATSTKEGNVAFYEEAKESSGWKCCLLETTPKARTHLLAPGRPLGVSNSLPLPLALSPPGATQGTSPACSLSFCGCCMLLGSLPVFVLWVAVSKIAYSWSNPFGRRHRITKLSWRRALKASSSSSLDKLGHWHPEKALAVWLKVTQLVSGHI